MKILSVTQGDGRVIELTSEEFKEFAILALALEGKTTGEAQWEFQMRRIEYVNGDEFDFRGVFGTIKAFYEAQFRVNDLRELTNRLQSFLDHEK